MELIDKQDAILILDPYIEGIFQCMKAAISDYQKLSADFKLSMCVTAKAWIIRQREIFHLKEKYNQEEKDDIKIEVDENGLFIFRIKNVLNLRFNKLSKSYNISSKTTNRIRAFKNQEELFPGFNQTGVNLVAGYIPDPAWENFSYYISCPNGETNSWYMEIGTTIPTTIEIHRLSELDLTGTEEEMSNIKIKSDTLKKVNNEGNLF
ncbi:MAG: hypothetical protein EPN82_05645 [Bacteroidetes bacterium]|nr:MAG: hypothetical protein EPN82_05645 [Bacteroidota bacterium]